MAKHKSTDKFTLSNLAFLKQSGRLIIPDYQRDEVWAKYQKQLLIDSILRKIDIPKLYFDVEGSDEKYKVVDGQQRIQAIISFLGNEFKLSSDFDEVDDIVIAGKSFNELPVDLQMNFNNSNLDIVKLYEYEEDEVKEIFIRHQEGTSLNAAEKRRALPGNVPAIIEKLASHNIFDTENLLGFKNKRFAFQDRCAKIFHQFYKGKITTIKPNEIKQSYQDNQDLSEDAQVVKDIQRSFKILKNALNNKGAQLKQYSLLRLTFLINEMRNQYNLKDYVNEFGEAYIDFELKRAKDSRKEPEDRDPILVEFSNSARGDSLAGQEYIHKILKREIMQSMPDLRRKDQQRNFSSTQRWIIFQRSRRKCQADKNASWHIPSDCSNDLTLNNFEADHVIPHSQGGPTSIQNGQALCATCNGKKLDHPNL